MSAATWPGSATTSSTSSTAPSAYRQRPASFSTPDELRAYGDHLTKIPEWGPEPPCWQVALAQMDWYVEAMLVEQALRAPFPWFGGKSRVADLVWDRFGDPRNYVEPFCGSAGRGVGRAAAGAAAREEDGTGGRGGRAAWAVS
jgi:hypothetical protein